MPFQPHPVYVAVSYDKQSKRATRDSMSTTNWVLFLRIFIIPLPKSYTPTRAYFNKFDLNACFDFIAINVVCVCLGSFFVILFVKFTSGNFNRVN